MGWAPRCASAIGCAAFPVGCGWDAFLLLSALVELQLPKTKVLEDARGPSAASSSQAFRGSVPTFAGSTGELLFHLDSGASALGGKLDNPHNCF